MAIFLLPSQSLPNRCSIFTRMPGRGIKWPAGAKWSDRSTYFCCLWYPWPLILLDVDIYVGIIHWCIGRWLGRESPRAKEIRGSKWWNSVGGGRQRLNQAWLLNYLWALLSPHSQKKVIIHLKVKGNMHLILCYHIAICLARTNRHKIRWLQGRSA